MTKQIKSKGFTIVELLIVIVVIAILAAITIVAYNGIQARAHTTAQKTTAENLAKKMEAYNAVSNAYPTFTSTTAITPALNTVTDSSLTGSGITITASTPTASTADGTVQLKVCGTSAAPTAGAGVVPTGYVVYIWDSTLSSAGPNAVQAGGNATITAGTGGNANTVAGAGTNGSYCTATS